MPSMTIQGLRLSPLIFPSPSLSNVGKYGKITALALSATSLVVNGENLYIDTFNVDQRSAVLNTEIALINRSRELALQVEHAAREDTSQERSWFVLADGSGAPQWPA